MRKDLESLNLGSIASNSRNLLNEYYEGKASIILAQNTAKLKVLLADANIYASEKAGLDPVKHETLVKYYMDMSALNALSLADAVNLAKKSPILDSTFYEEAVSMWLKSNHIRPADGNWIMPQLVALFGRLTLPTMQDGLFYVKDLIALNKSDELFGAVQLARYSRRSEFLTSQTARPNNEYCTLVPLVLLGIRKFHGIGYTKWSKAGLDFIVPTELFSLMTSSPIVADRAELLRVREDAKIVKSGKLINTIRTTKSMNKVYGTYHIFPEGTPQLLKVVTLQVWCAAPEYRHENMVLDPVNWDGYVVDLMFGVDSSEDINAATLTRIYCAENPSDAPDVSW